MSYHPERPLVVQHDRTIYIEVTHPDYEQIRNQLYAFAELIKSPEHIHTYRITPLSLWNAAASGWKSAQVLQCLDMNAKFPLPESVIQSIQEDMDKYGWLRLYQREQQLVFASHSEQVLEQLSSYSSFSSYFISGIKKDGNQSYLLVDPSKRGVLKQQSLSLGYPVIDEAGYHQGDLLPLSWRDRMEDGTPFRLRRYQQEAAQAFYKQGSLLGGQGVLVLPCGAGKTIIGIESMIKLQCATLIVTSNSTSVQQWKRELLQKTTIEEDQVGEYTGEKKEIRPITVATYQMLTYRKPEQADYEHMHIFMERNWGLIVYDEVHLLPAPVFRATAAIQSTRRLGLTATLVREDGREEDVFSLVGPKCYDIPWRDLERDGYIAKAWCTEIRTSLDPSQREKYYLAPARQKARLAQENPKKMTIVRRLIDQHQGKSILIIGQYVDQLEAIGQELDVPVLTGKTKQAVREKLYQRFKQGEIPILVVSKIANFAIDLPDASVAIQISGTYGSRQEEAQRLGRILRPKERENEAYFYSIVTKDSKDQEYASKRQLFLIEQGYRYQLIEEVEE